MFKGLGNLANLGEVMKQASQMGAKMQEMQERLKTQRHTGEAGGGMVTILVTGTGEAITASIDPGLVERGEREMIEELVVAAVNDAAGKVKRAHAEVMQEMTGGLNLPGMGDMLAKLGGGQQQ